MGGCTGCTGCPSLKMAKIVMAPLVHYSVSHEKVEIGYFSSLEVESWGVWPALQNVKNGKN